jgi:hypothetical protein
MGTEIKSLWVLAGLLPDVPRAPMPGWRTMPDLLPDGTLPATTHVVPRAPDGTPTQETSAACVARGLLLAGYTELDTYNYLRARYVEVPSGFLWYTQEVTPGYVHRQRLALVDAGLVPYIRYGKQGMV